MIVIWHNPKCSKSREALDLLKKSGKEYQVRDYVSNPPSLSELKSVLKLLKMKPHELLRTKEAVFSELKLENFLHKSEFILKTMIQHPKLIERPIVFNYKKAVIGRPTERIKEIL